VRRAKVRDLLEAVGLADRARHRPVELSGGERQRVAIARALANGPSLVLADEPTGNLDDASTARVVTLLESLPADHGCTLVLVTHDLALAERASRRLRLRGGRAVEETVGASTPSGVVPSGVVPSGVVPASSPPTGRGMQERAAEPGETP